MARAAGMAWLAALGLLASCGAASDGSGATALLRVEGAQFVPGDVAAPAGGPAVASLLDEQPSIRAGEVAHALSGTLAAGATAVVLRLDGDSGAWILAAGVPDITAPSQPTFHARLDFAPTLPAGPGRITVRGVDASGRIGAPAADAITLTAAPAPAGAMVVSLTWDTAANLDLRFVEPGGFEIGTRAGADPFTGGRLDLDSNEGCVQDGWRREDVVYAAPPPPGRYLARVDTPSLCGATTAHWQVQVLWSGAVLATARGEVTPEATLAPHGAGAGLTALEFEVR